MRSNKVTPRLIVKKQAHTYEQANITREEDEEDPRQSFQGLRRQMQNAAIVPKADRGFTFQDKQTARNVFYDSKAL